jgi:ERCC4-related helicase
MQITPHQAKFYAHALTSRQGTDGIGNISQSLFDACVDMNPHQVDAALFACQNPLSQGVILADEVGLGKTIEAGLVISQCWAERRRRILIIVPANLRKQWHQELQEKFALDCVLLESKNYNAMRKQASRSPFDSPDQPVICSYQFAKSKADDVAAIGWDLVVMDEAHRLRNVYKKGNVIARTLKESLAHVRSKVLLTATPLQNSLLELYGLVSMIDDRVFGDLDSFRSQFSQPGEAALAGLRARLGGVCKRTLRRQVQQYVPYTARRAILQEFTPSAEEQELSHLVADYLRRPSLKALPDGQRQLISLVLWKLLASSSHAIAGALDTMANRLQGVLDEAPEIVDLGEALDQDYESLDETADEWSEELGESPPSAQERQAIANEVAELRHFKSLATHIHDNAKGTALLQALGKAFAELERLGAPRKAIIFTESRRTQDYLLSLLEDTPYGDDIVLFNGTNGDARAKAVYKDWLERHHGTGMVTGSKTADTRAALVEHFRDRGTVMIATEAGAEGINLQFCSLVINYDLPWNPQRIEQRIGRCHRYGQKHDVVVVNFVDRSNEADARVYELLAHKFQLFEGVFGASDEVLGAIGSGVDFERRIADIYRNCREPDAIRASFEQLQLDLSGEISEQMVKTRQILLENFDEDVHDKLRLRAEDSHSTLDRYGQMLMDLTETGLAGCASFESGGFMLQQLPAPNLRGVELGRYELPRRSGEAHLYRLGHPLAEWLIDQAKQRELDGACLVFDYDAYGKRITTLEPFRGKAGWLSVHRVRVEALGREEDHLIVAAVTADGTVLEEGDPEKLLRLPAQAKAVGLFSAVAGPLEGEVERRKHALMQGISERNLGYFGQEVEKLDAWADDLKLGLEQEIKAIDLQIKETRRHAAVAATLEQKLVQQKAQRELEGKRSKLRRDLFNRQDEVEARRNELIEQLEDQMQQTVNQELLFLVEWELR